MCKCHAFVGFGLEASCLKNSISGNCIKVKDACFIYKWYLESEGVKKYESIDKRNCVTNFKWKSYWDYGDKQWWKAQFTLYDLCIF